MGILRADLLTHSQLQPTGSVFFDGTDDKITTTGFGNIDTSDFTFECWVYLSTTSGTQRIMSADEGSQSTEYTQIRAHSTHGWQAYIGTDSGWWEAKSGNDHATFTTGWHHVVLQRFGNDGYIFVDGQYVITSQDGSSAVNAADPVTITTFVLGHGYGSEYLNAGYISNARISMKAVYGGTNFTPPKFELKPLGETYLLCCQSSSSSSEAAVAPSAGLTVTGAAASSFTPDLKKDITDTGVVFDGFGNFATSTYMVPPSGKTTERNRGRALLGGGHNPSGATNHIHQLSIQSQGNTEHFGDLTYVRLIPAPSSSYTRGVWSGGGGPSPGSPTGAYVNFIDFVTIANSSNATDFGDQTAEKGYHAGLSNETRGIIAGGYNDSVGKIDVIEFITIATAGNAQDFGDLTAARMQLAAAGSPTRGLFFGGSINPNVLGNVVDFITIATTGNAQDFGDMTSTTKYGNATSSNTRAIYAGGLAPNDTTYVNTIEYFTIATTGDATDFGDLTATRSTTPGATSNNIRGIFAGGYVPGNVNSIDFVTIASVGHAAYFGDITSGALRGIVALSDSHGGLS